MRSFRKEVLTVGQELRKAVAGLTTMVSDLNSKVSSLVSQSKVVINASVTNTTNLETTTSQQVLDPPADVEAGAGETQFEYTCSTTE